MRDRKRKQTVADIAWTKANADKVRAYKRKWRNKNIERERASARIRAAVYRRENPERVRAIWRKCHFRITYGISVEERDSLLDKQGGKCALCGRGNGTRSLFLDHDHNTGEIRGVVCGLCNAFLSRVDADPEYIDKLRKYLSPAL